MKDDKPGADSHQSPEHSSPYPVSRLSPPIDLVDLARQIDRADKMLHTKVGAQLSIIADQIHALQEQARLILEKAKKDKELHRVRCTFRKRPGKVYHLYAREDGTLYFSLLSPAEWKESPPHFFRGSFRLEADYSWTPLE